MSTGREFIVTWLQKTSHHPLASFSPDQLNSFSSYNRFKHPTKTQMHCGYTLVEHREIRNWPQTSSHNNGNSPEERCEVKPKTGFLLQEGAKLRGKGRIIRNRRLNKISFLSQTQDTCLMCVQQYKTYLWNEILGYTTKMFSQYPSSCRYIWHRQFKETFFCIGFSNVQLI